MKSFLSLVLICCLLVVFLAPSIALAQTSVKIIKLRYQSPAAMATLLRQTFGSEVRVAEAPTVNGVVISAAQADLLRQAEELVNSLDTTPRTLRYQIRVSGSSSSTLQGGGLNISSSGHGSGKIFGLKPTVRQTRQTVTDGESRTVVGLEGHPVSLTSAITRVEHFDTVWGPQDTMRTEQRGLSVVGRLCGSREVMLEVFYAEGSFNDSRRLITQIQAPLGTWVDLGALDDSGTSRNQDIGLSGNRGQGNRQQLQTSGSRRYSVMVNTNP
jgi:hypothetical protein